MFPHQNVAMAQSMVTSIQQGAANSSPSPLAGGQLAAINSQEMDTVLKGCITALAQVGILS